MRFDCPASWDDFQDEASVLTFQQPHSHLERPQLEEALHQEVGKLKRYYSTLSKKSASIYFIRVQVGTNQPLWNAGTRAAAERKNKPFLADANKAYKLHWDNCLKIFAYPFTGMITL